MDINKFLHLLHQSKEKKLNISSDEIDRQWEKFSKNIQPTKQQKDWSFHKGFLTAAFIIIIAWLGYKYWNTTSDKMNYNSDKITNEPVVDNSSTNNPTDIIKNSHSENSHSSVKSQSNSSGQTNNNQSNKNDFNLKSNDTKIVDPKIQRTPNKNESGKPIQNFNTMSKEIVIGTNNSVLKKEYINTNNKNTSLILPNNKDQSSLDTNTNNDQQNSSNQVLYDPSFDNVNIDNNLNHQIGQEIDKKSNCATPPIPLLDVEYIDQLVSKIVGKKSIIQLPKINIDLMKSPTWTIGIEGNAQFKKGNNSLGGRVLIGKDISARFKIQTGIGFGENHSLKTEIPRKWPKPPHPHPINEIKWNSYYVEIPLRTTYKVIHNELWTLSLGPQVSLFAFGDRDAKYTFKGPDGMKEDKVIKINKSLEFQYGIYAGMDRKVNNNILLSAGFTFINQHDPRNNFNVIPSANLGLQYKF